MKQVRRVNPWLVGLAVGLIATVHEHETLALIPLNPGANPLKYEHPSYLRGTVYAGDPNEQRVLFKFIRLVSRLGSTLKVQHEFTYPNGTPAAREKATYEGDALVSYALEELQTGAVGGASLRRSPNNPLKGCIEFTYAPEAGGRAKTRTEGLAENTLVTDMVGAFLVSHWKDLERGEKVKCRFIVVPRRETVGFSFVKDSECKWQGCEATVIRLEANSPFVATQVAPLFFTLEKAPPHRLLQYTGRTTPKIQSGGKWKDLDAVTVFDWSSAR